MRKGKASAGYAGKEIKQFQPLKDLEVEIVVAGETKKTRVKVDGRHSFGGNEAQSRNRKRASK